MKNGHLQEKDEHCYHEKGWALLQYQETEPVKTLQLKIVEKIVLGGCGGSSGTGLCVRK